MILSSPSFIKISLVPLKAKIFYIYFLLNNKKFQKLKIIKHSLISQIFTDYANCYCSITM